MSRAAIHTRADRSVEPRGSGRRLRTSARATRARDAVRRQRRVLSHPRTRTAEQPASHELLDELFDLEDPDFDDELTRLGRLAAACREEDREI